MSKRIIAGALAVGLTVTAFAVLAVPTFAASTSWQQVTVAPGTEFVIGGNTASNTTLAPTISANASQSAGAMAIQATASWELTWLAVTGTEVTKNVTAATGTNLGASGFTNSGGYAYAGLSATTGANTWGASLAGANGATIETTYSLGTTASVVAKGAPTSTATVTATYSAGTDGSLGTSTYYGTIYYNLRAQ